MKRGIKNILLGIVGFSAAPILTACYGSPYDDRDPDQNYETIEGYVVNTEMKPIKNIRVSVTGSDAAFTDVHGHFKLTDYFYGDVMITAEDLDGTANLGDHKTASVVVNGNNNSTVSIVMSKK